MDEAKKIRVTVAAVDEYEDREWVGESFADFTAWVNEVFDAIPEEYRNVAQLDIDHNSLGNSNYSQIEVYYYRYETPEEVAAREAKLIEAERLKETQERQIYERLKAKGEVC